MMRCPHWGERTFPLWRKWAIGYGSAAPCRACGGKVRASAWVLLLCWAWFAALIAHMILRPDPLGLAVFGALAVIGTFLPSALLHLVPREDESVRAVLLPNGNLLVPAGPGPDDDTGEDSFQELGPDHPEYGHWLALSQPGEDPRTRRKGN